MTCHKCGNTWDAWVNDNGTLEKPRDAYCVKVECQSREVTWEATDPSTAGLTANEVKVHRWRVAVLKEAGADEYVADLLAATSYDLRRMAIALQQGCPPDVALRIVL